jgi:murein DD-endopeptidase MepM/ murein hydrolase activator NlpD
LNIIGHESSWRSNVIAPDLGYGWFQLTGHQSEISNEDACSNFAQACLVACNILLVAMKTNCSSPASASGANWLNGLAAYNSGQNAKGMGAGDYTALVLGEGQRDAILNGQQTPANAKPGAVRTGLACANQTADLTKWPFDVYGPIGMHPSSVANVSPGTTTAQAKQILLGNAPNFATAMNTSVKYMDYLLHKYQNTAFNPNAPVYNSFLTQSDLFSKVIAAWFSDEQVIGAENANACHNAIQQIKKLYDACIACTNSPDTYSPTNLSELHAALDGIIFINPLPGSKIYSGWRCASRPNHQGIDLALDNSYGAAVVACADGVIGQYGYRGARTGTGGYGLQITHTTNGQPNGAESIYYDMGPVYTVQPGATVKRGQTVGYLAANDAAQASTGATETGIHLHWELHTGINSFSPNTDKSNTVNPNAVLYRQGKNDAIPYWGGADTIGQGGY